MSKANEKGMKKLIPKIELSRNKTLIFSPLRGPAGAARAARAAPGRNRAYTGRNSETLLFLALVSEKEKKEVYGFI